MKKLDMMNPIRNILQHQKNVLKTYSYTGGKKDLETVQNSLKNIKKKQ